MRTKKTSKIALTAADRAFYIISGVVLVIVLVVALYPLYFVLIASISNYKAVGRGEVLLWPVDITFDSYLKVFSRKNILIEMCIRDRCTPRVSVSATEKSCTAASSPIKITVRTALRRTWPSHSLQRLPILLWPGRLGNSPPAPRTAIPKAIK